MSSESNQFLGTVLVTGGAGIVGSFVCEELVKHPQCSRVVATYHSKKEQHSCPGVDYFVCDITNPIEVKQLLEETQPTLIIHTVSPQPLAAPEVQHKVNYLATKELVEQAKTHPVVQALIFTSSIQAVVLKSSSAKEPQTEEETILNTLSSTAASSAYGRTKGAADALVLAANTGTQHDNKTSSYCGRLLTTTLRIAGLYGERDLKTIWEMVKVVNTTATRFQIGPDKVVHEWVYTANVAQAHVLAAEALLYGKHTTPETRVDGEAFFITDDSPMKFWEFSRKVWIAAGDKYLTASESPRITEVPFWMANFGVSAAEAVRKLWNADEMQLSRHQLGLVQAGNRFSIEKAKTRLGYKPRYNTDEGIKRSVAWFLQEENKVWLKT